MEGMLEVRKLRFDMGDVPRHWHSAGRSVGTFLDNLSVFFPAGERFFVSAVNAHLKRIDDPALLADARAFAGQEGNHGREHKRWNALVGRHYPVEAMEGRVERLLGFVTRKTTRRMQLAATCALEHFTALMGKLLLEEPRVLEGAHPTMAALWKWHAAEENEHKSVAFDVYVASGGGYAVRVTSMLVATVIFWAKVIEHQARMMKVDGTLFSPREHWTLFKFLVVDPGTMRGLFKPYLAYFRPGFHPTQIDSTAVIEGWRASGAPRAS
jgi:hypothetical protein